MDDELAEKRVFTRHGDSTDVFVAADIGVVSVAVSGDRIGRYGVVHRCSPVDIAAAPGRLCVATTEDVVVSDGGRFTTTGFGPSVAVAAGPGIMAAAPDGRVARYDGDTWTPVGELDAEIRAIAGDLVATSAGVYRIAGTVSHVGLRDVRDVATDGRPLAATADGLYHLGNGWMAAADGDFLTVATDGNRAHAATARRVFELRNDQWATVELPSAEMPVAFAYGPAVFGVTADGTLLVDAGSGFRAHRLGLPGVVGMASAPPA